MKKNLLRITFSLFLLSIILYNFSFIFAGFGYGFNENYIPSGNRITDLDTTANNIWATISAVLKILAIAGVIITGIKYMFSTFDAKAKIKESLPVLIIGIVIVFAGTTLVDFIVRVFNDATN